MGLLAALGFLTTLPVPRKASAAHLARSLSYFPLVGALLGGLLLAFDWLLALAFPGTLRVALLLLASILLTRALHLDGLMDCCDGLWGGFTQERRLTIMRDSRVGAFGALGAILVLLLRYSGLIALAPEWRLAGFLLPPIVGRWAMVWATVAYPYARPEGLGLAFKSAATWREATLATLSAALLGAALWWPWGALALVPALLLTILLARFMVARLGGLTGDCYGAINEVVECLILIGVVGVARYTTG